MSFQAVKTWKQSNDPDFEVKKNRILELYDIADGKIEPGHGRSDGGDLRRRVRAAQPATPSRPPVGGRRRQAQEPSPCARRRRRATYTRPHGVRHLLAGYDLSTDRLYGHIKKHKGRTEFLAFVRYLRSLHPPEVRIAIVMDNFSPHLSTKKDRRVGRVGSGQQRRARLHTALRVVAQPDRGPIPGVALLRPRRDRSPQPPRASPDDPPLHRLAQPQRPRPGTT